jgi:DNA-binding NtrC family response regulator
LSVLITLTDVEPAVRLGKLLEGEELETEMVSPLDDFRSALRRARPEVVVMTGGLLDPHNMQLVREMLWDDIAVIGFADVRDAEIDERLRATGFIEVFSKPVVLDEVVESIKQLLRRQELSRLTGLIGESEAIRQVLVQVEQIAPVSSTVLIEGESGTGKELVARAIHRLSPRRNKPFIAVNVGALPETLLESELFGHEKGAFTGAAERRIGRFELAHTGTLFLDEIGDVPAATQVKLLRVLEERVVTRVGGTQETPIDVRVVAATNAPLREGVEQGRFRADLFYRLNVLRIYLPPLRERRQDIPLLVRRFIRELSKAHDRPFHGLSAEALQRLVEYPWPGNIRELRNLIESMVVLSPGREIGREDIPPQIRDAASARFLPVHLEPVLRDARGSDGRELEFILRSLVELKLQMEEMRRRVDEFGAANVASAMNGGQWVGEVQAPAGSGQWTAIGGLGTTGIEARDQAPPANEAVIRPGMSMADVERAAIEVALRDTGGNRRRAAEMLQIGERTLYRKLREYQLPVDELVLDDAGDRSLQ